MKTGEKVAIAAAGGLLVGGLAIWFSGRGTRREVRRLREELGELQAYALDLAATSWQLRQVIRELDRTYQGALYLVWEERQRLVRELESVVSAQAEAKAQIAARSE